MAPKYLTKGLRAILSILIWTIFLVDEDIVCFPKINRQLVRCATLVQVQDSSSLELLLEKNILVSSANILKENLEEEFGRSLM